MATWEENRTITLNFECQETADEFKGCIAREYHSHLCPNVIGLEDSCNFNDRNPQPTDAECGKCWNRALDQAIRPRHREKEEKDMTIGFSDVLEMNGFAEDMARRGSCPDDIGLEGICRRSERKPAKGEGSGGSNAACCVNCWLRALRTNGGGASGRNADAGGGEEPMPITGEMKSIAGKAVSEACKKVNQEIRFSVERGRAYALFAVDKDDPAYAAVKRKYEAAGYSISPLGYSGGVPQDGEKITW